MIAIAITITTTIMIRITIMIMIFLGHDIGYCCALVHVDGSSAAARGAVLQAGIMRGCMIRIRGRKGISIG